MRAVYFPPHLYLIVFPVTSEVTLVDLMASLGFKMPKFLNLQTLLAWPFEALVSLLVVSQLSQPGLAISLLSQTVPDLIFVCLWFFFLQCYSSPPRFGSFSFFEVSWYPPRHCPVPEEEQQWEAGVQGGERQTHCTQFNEPGLEPPPHKGWEVLAVRIQAIDPKNQLTVLGMFVLLGLSGSNRVVLEVCLRTDTGKY